jgi:hypothetical protein
MSRVNFIKQRLSPCIDQPKSMGCNIIQ